MSLLIENIQQEKEDTLTDYDILSDCGTALIFIKNNFSECLSIFGAKVISEIIDDAREEYNNVLTEGMSTNHNDPPPPIVDVQGIWDTIKDHSDGISGVVLAAVALSGAYKAYKNYFSKAAKACKGKSGEEKTACMLNYEERALSVQSEILDKSLSISDKSSDPKKYISKITKEIKKIKSKIVKLKKKK